MELQIIESQLPVIKSNYEELKTHIQTQLAKYENLVVTEETQTDCKKTKQELSKLEKQIDRFRIDKATELAVPIAKFEGQMKELKALVTSVVDPIDKQLKMFEEERKAEKRETVNKIMIETIVSYKLDEKHAPLLTFDERYLNKTFEPADIEVDLKNKAEVLKISQKTIAANKQLVIDTCAMHEGLSIDPAPWINLLETQEVAEVVTSINASVKTQIEKKQAEERRKQEAELEAQRQKMLEEHEAKLEAQRQKMLEEQELEHQRVQAEFEQKQAELQKQIEQPAPEPIVHTQPIKLDPEILEGEVKTILVEVRGTEEQLNGLWRIMDSISIGYKKIGYKKIEVPKEDKPEWA